jgi:pyrroloquinoline quinone biosynthesis protein B
MNDEQGISNFERNKVQGIMNDEQACPPLAGSNENRNNNTTTLQHFSNMPRWFFLFLLFFACRFPEKRVQVADFQNIRQPALFLTVLGIAQDAGYPQAGCGKTCCQTAWKNAAKRKMVSCLAIADPQTRQAWLFDATPDFREQLHLLEDDSFSLAGIFLTHAHIGHYTGLAHLGREVMGAKKMSVFAMPRMKNFLSENGPWSQLVKLQNIDLQSLAADSAVILNSKFSVTPLLVPHRDEFSETVGFRIRGPAKSALFIPDIDKWHLWERDILEEIRQVDYAFLDGTFYQNGEIPRRDMREIPHPFVVESMQLFKDLPAAEKAKIHFIHFNHTNPVLQQNSLARAAVLQAGFRLAEEEMMVELE